jgi:2-methylisocitrate lyase-like PEP mutase family enzyme
MTSQAEKARLFESLHQQDRAFIIPNPWDVGSAKLLAHLSFKALASTSAGYAFSSGVADCAVGRDDMLRHLTDLCGATDLPVNADLENGYGDSPETVAETITLAAQTGIVGGSIEDFSGDPSQPIYPLDVAVERVRAGIEAARALPFHFIFTARAENFLHGNPDLKDTIRRLQAFQEAGADVLYAPGLSKKEDIEAVVSSVDRPVNVLCGGGAMRLTADELSRIGVKRISTGSSLSLAALGAFLRACAEMQEHGTFDFVRQGAGYKDITAMLTGKAGVL